MAAERAENGANATGIGAKAAFLARAEHDSARDVADAARRLCH